MNLLIGAFAKASVTSSVCSLFNADRAEDQLHPLPGAQMMFEKVDDDDGGESVYDE